MKQSIFKYLMSKQWFLRLVSETLPDMDDARVTALNIIEENNPELSAQQQAFFVAGFTSCVAYLDKTKYSR